MEMMHIDPEGELFDVWAKVHFQYSQAPPRLDSKKWTEGS